MLQWLKRDHVAQALATDRSAQKIIDGFSYVDPCKALEEAHTWLGSIAETASFKLQRRYELLELLDGATLESNTRLLVQYLELPPGDAQSERFWQVATDFWKRLGGGYLQCARQAANAEMVTSALKPRLPRLAALGLRALRLQMKWALLRYAAVRNELWGECGRFLMLAEAQNGALTPSAPLAGNRVLGSPYQEMLKLMLFWQAMPSGLSPFDQHVAEQLVVQLAPKAACHRQLAQECDFFFDVDGVRPLARWAPNAQITAATRFIDATASCEALRELYTAASRAQTVPLERYLGPAAEPYVVKRVLRHLWVGWGKTPPQRASRRLKANNSMLAVYGFDAVLGLIMGQSAPALSLALAPAAGEVDLARTDRWVASDISATGLGVVVPQGKGQMLCVGQLVALRTEREPTWRIGIVRRVSGLQRQHHLGIQVLSQRALPVYLRTLTGARQGRAPVAGILLSDTPSASGSFHILARRDLFGTSEAIEAVFGAQPSALTLEPAGEAESGQDFDWLRYKLATVVH
ncbi:MAG: hypothetical protein FJY56_14770 [Betaproteobacteria bacterium]|nr:hypothetical protein [Betaproteobacteria bacterium]